MFVLKPDTSKQKDKGNFVDNLRQTIGILTNSCRWVPKTAFQRNDTKRRTNDRLTLPDVTIPRLKFYSPEVSPYPLLRSPSTQAVIEHEYESDFEVEECVLLDEPVGIEDFTRDPLWG